MTFGVRLFVVGKISEVALSFGVRLFDYHKLHST